MNTLFTWNSMIIERMGDVRSLGPSCMHPCINSSNTSAWLGLQALKSLWQSCAAPISTGWNSRKIIFLALVLRNIQTDKYMSRKQGFYPHLTSSSSQQSLLLILALTLLMVSEELASTDDSWWKFAYCHSNGPRLWVASGLITRFLNKQGGFFSHGGNEQVCTQFLHRTLSARCLIGPMHPSMWACMSL